MKKDYFIKLEDVSLSYNVSQSVPTDIKQAILNIFSPKAYGANNKSIQSLDTVNLEIREGDRLGILGLNGAGKSSLLKVISGIIKPTGGKVTVSGAIQPLIEIGAGFDPEFSGRENIYLNGYMLGFGKRQLKKKEQEIINFSGLSDFIDTPVKYYSSGMTIRLAFTIATMIEPEILLIDEMLGAGDAAFIKKAKKRIDDVLNFAKIIVMVSHDEKIIKETCNKVLVMHKGKKIFYGDMAEGRTFYHHIVEAHSE